MDRFYRIAQDILKGYEITFPEAQSLMETADKDVLSLVFAANTIREHFTGKFVDLCSIINAKSGNCSENCSFCAQSSHHKTEIKKYPLLDSNAIIARSREVYASGIKHFGIVIAGKGVTPNDFTRVVETVSIIKGEIKESQTIDCGLGLLTPAQAGELRDAGAGIYNHNLECSRSYFPEMCTTHTYDERVETIRNAHEAGLLT